MLPSSHLHIINELFEASLGESGLKKIELEKTNGFPKIKLLLSVKVKLIQKKSFFLSAKFPCAHLYLECVTLDGYLSACMGIKVIEYLYDILR